LADNRVGDRRDDPFAVHTGDEQDKVGSLLHVFLPRQY
jgi:hypothetical protein